MLNQAVYRSFTKMHRIVASLHQWRSKGGCRGPRTTPFWGRHFAD